MTSHIKDIVSIVRYGYYSNPISNYILSKTKEKSVEYYLLLLKNIWKKNKNMAIFYANKIIATTTTTTTILRELARFELISLYVKNNQFDMAKKECEYLRNNFKNISEYARNLMIPGLKLLNTKYNILDKDFKAYSDNYEENNVDKAILKYSQAREYIKNKEYNKAYELFIEGYFLAKDFPHPTMMCNGLNGAAWWMRNEDKKKALIPANLLEYYIGYYFDDLNYTYNWFDTIFEVYKINKSLNLFDISSVVMNYKNNVSFEIKSDFEEVYNNKSYFRNRSFKKIISHNFRDNLSIIEKVKNHKIPILFFSTYTTLIEKPFFTKSHILKLIFEGNKDKIIKFFSANYEKMYFFNVMMSDFNLKKVERRLLNSEDVEDSEYNISPFYLARKKLITELFKKPKNFKEFVFNYFKLSDEEMKIFDVFLRNCVRYDIKWPITPYPKGKVRDFALKYGLGYKRVALGYYSFEDDERVLLDDIIERFL
ncbi:hypothetical protein XO10_07435 [Marinitoga sp. 1135]|uniref:hypothetical protein n=1 Tax=Marinitoga sp. 1135 TaxID=1643333 RepID=UPI001586269E|nr:hypothetical protein [Marinitoga sp. 1135]NUU96105.1 hypothetical protein [Marinitoga sp. 1135]